MMYSRKLDRAVPIVIAGAGPVGLTLSSLLSRFGVQHLVFDRERSGSTHPQAHFLHARAMEIFRHAFAPSVYNELHGMIEPLACWRHFSFQTSIMEGRTIGHVDHFAPSNSASRMSSADILAQFSSAQPAHLSQSRLQPVLRKAALDANQQVYSAWEVKDVKHAKSQGLSVCVRDCVSGLTFDIQCDYLVAADGASSSVRQCTGVGMEGPESLAHLLNIHFTSKTLAEATMKQPAMLHFIYNPHVMCVIVTHHFGDGEYCCHLPFFPMAQEPDDFDQSRIRRLLFAAIGKEVPDLTVHSMRHWRMDAQVASRFIGGPAKRVLFLGDAAHRLPPSGGFGLNLGIHDAHNLAWKLACALEQPLQAELLLDSYQVERQCIAQHIREISLQNYERSLRVPQALLRTDPDAIKAFSHLPKQMFEQVMAAGRRPLASLSIPGQPHGEARLKEARRVLAEGAGLPLLFPQVDLGVNYADKSLMPPEQLGQLRVGCRFPARRFIMKHAPARVCLCDLPDQLHQALSLQRTPRAVVLGSSSALKRLRDQRQAATIQLGTIEVPAIWIEVVVRSNPWGERRLQAPILAETLCKSEKAHILQGGSMCVIDATGAWGDLTQQGREHAQSLAQDQHFAEMVVVIRPDGHVSDILWP